MSISRDELRELSVAERLKLLDNIWETLLEETALPPLSPAQLSEVDRRLEGYRQRGNQGIPWEDLDWSLQTA